MATLTVYPDPNPETTSVDGGVDSGDVGSTGDTWANIVALPGGAGTASDNGANCTAAYMLSAVTPNTNKFREIGRSIFLFDTSALTASVIVSAAIMSLFETIHYNDFTSATPAANVFSSAPASNTALADGDFDSLGTTPLATAIPWTSLTVGGYCDWTLNATGLAAIAKTGITKFGIRESVYDAPNSAPTWRSLSEWIFNVKCADTAGTTNDPKLVITYALPSTPSRVYMFNQAVRRANSY